MNVAQVLILAAVVSVLYTYAGYPLLLLIAGRLRRRVIMSDAAPAAWPVISITVPVYNEESQIRPLLESLLRLDYPADRRQILIVSDASTDGTDAIVREYADRGVELVRQEHRRGKTAAESAARARLRGEIVINTDASIRIAPDAIKPLVRCFRDATVGVASGRDVSVTRVDAEANAGEAGYIGYEMAVRDLETRLHGIVGASGCFYAIRPHLHAEPLPDGLSRDFASALAARTHGYRAVSVPEAVCLVPRSASLRREYARKVRTMTRGMQTLIFYRHLFNPLRYGVFSWMLFSHKVCRWLTPWAALAGGIGIVIAAMSQGLAEAGVTAALALVALALAGWHWPEGRSVPLAFSLPAFLLVGNVAVLHATIRVLLGRGNPLWEPTRREPVDFGVTESA